ncbi:1-deoxy-D-xylulose-5-phosphate reductoisomerase [Pelagibacteraceae bacterium]|nr:1-deoxy-D-xylulose-5-phosphate reductoisomerase [Pelagibacteraceae bacterium]MDC1124338.1 1-deoxy-D-xylulose-5-phosphate reductoisomerase [Pelagibacteraceae bacterium]
MVKSISILGSTGSVGVSTLSIIDKKKDYFKIYLLSANKNFYLIKKQIKKYKPKIFVITNKDIYEKIKKKFSKNKIIISNTFNELTIPKKNDITISAIPGIVGLEPTIQMVKSSKKILIANKESIICGWHLIKKTALKYNTKIIPIDSEHFSILKLLENHSLKEIEKIYITASGGPFLNYKKNQLKNIKIKDALNHPKWKMGKKITIDSSTLMNKILELIEAQKIFNIPNKKLDILIHPNSLVHAIIEMKNGLIKFLYHDTTMIIPLANAIFDGKININDFIKNKKKLKAIEDLYFKKVDLNIFPVIKFKNRLDEYPSTPIIINAANEVLVDLFLKKKIPFLSIYKIIMNILNDRNYKKYAIKTPININQILTIDNWAKNTTKKYVK